jgi:hypothetical protein
MIIMIVERNPVFQKKKRKSLAFDTDVRSGYRQSPLRLSAKTNIIVAYFGPVFVTPSGVHRLGDVLAERHRPSFVSGPLTGGRAWSTTKKVTKMIQMIDRDRAERPTDGQKAVAALKGVFLPHSTLRSPEVLQEPPERQIAWVRLVGYLQEMGLPFSGCTFPDQDRFWMTVCGLRAAEMHEPNGLWCFDNDNRLHLMMDAEEVVA